MRLGLARRLHLNERWGGIVLSTAGKCTPCRDRRRARVPDWCQAYERNFVHLLSTLLPRQRAIFRVRGHCLVTGKLVSNHVPHRKQQILVIRIGGIGPMGPIIYLAV